MSRPYKVNPRTIANFTDQMQRLYPDVKGLGAKTVTIVVTESCTLNCSYCYQKHKTSKVLSHDIIEQVVDAIFASDEDGGYLARVDGSDDRASGAIIIDFIGGEPLLAVSEMTAFMDHFLFKAIEKKHRWAEFYMISITTNGTEYLKEPQQRFIERFKNKLSLTITIDGNKELHDSCRVFPDGSGSYDIVEMAIKKHVKDFSNVSTKLTLAPENLEYLVDACKSLESLGINNIAANPVFEKGWDITHAKVYYEKLKALADYMLSDSRYVRIHNSLFEESIGKPYSKSENQNWCGGTGGMLAFDTEGNAYPCLRYMPFSINNKSLPSMQIGNLKDGIGTLPAYSKIVSEITVITRESQSTDECNSCKVGTGCAWCSAYNFDEFGTVNKRATYICKMHRARVLANAYYWNSVYKLTNNNDLSFKMTMPKEWALEIISAKEFKMLKGLSIR
jgi:uncharacterized protein